MNATTTHTPSSELLPHLRRFAEQAGTTPSVARLIRRWDRVIEVRDRDSGERFFLETERGELSPPQPVGYTTLEADILVEARREVLIDVFSGRLNPARAHLDGILTVIGEQRDHLVLDGVVMLIWGV